MSHDIAAILDDCLMRMRRGETVEECLSLYADAAAELRPLLETAVNLAPISPPVIPAAKVAAGRKMMFAAFDHQFVNLPVSKSPIARYAQQIITYITGMEDKNMTYLATKFAAAAFIALFAITGLGISAASAHTVPGDALYSVKTMGESVHLLLTSDAEQLQQEFQQRRQEEAAALLEMGREAEIAFQGELMRIDDTRWMVDDFTVLVDENTDLAEQLADGYIVEVSARTTAAGEIVASRFDVISPNEPSTPSTDGHPEPQGTADAPDQPEATQAAPDQPEATQEAPDQPEATQEAPDQPEATQEAPDQPEATQEAPDQPEATQEAPDQPEATQEAPDQPEATQEAPDQSVPTHEAPNQPVPTYEAPNQPAPTHEAPSQPAPTYEAPNQPAPTHEAPSQPAPTHEAPSQPAPTHEAPSMPSMPGTSHP